eukprot:1157255-Pelagomonas_calceolata.AAC.3
MMLHVSSPRVVCIMVQSAVAIATGRQPLWDKRMHDLAWPSVSTAPTSRHELSVKLSGLARQRVSDIAR